MVSLKFVNHGTLKILTFIFCFNASQMKILLLFKISDTVIKYCKVTKLQFFSSSSEKNLFFQKNHFDDVSSSAQDKKL